MVDDIFRLHPVNASTTGSWVDWHYFFLVGMSLVISIGISVAIIILAFRYHRSRTPRHEPGFETNLKLELTWIIIPFFILMGIFVWSSIIFFHKRTPPVDSMEIYVVGKQWMWKIQHPGGRSEIDELHIPVDRPIRLKMTSEDVIHSFYVPAFRTKMDVVPGMYTTTWFEANRTGEYHLFCAEYCGTDHSGMIGRVVVMQPEEYSEWLRGGEMGVPPQAAGEALFERHRCNDCHVQDDEARCPSLVGLLGRQVRLSDGQVIVADEAYIRESILRPHEQIVAGYPSIMPSYEGQLNEEQIFQLIAYIKTLQPEDVDQVDVPLDEDLETQP